MPARFLRRGGQGARPFLLLALLLALASAAPAHAEVRVEASLDPQGIEAGTASLLTIHVEGAGGVEEKPAIRVPDGLRIAEAGESRSFSMVNGRITKSVDLQYQVIALRPGSYSIEPFEVRVGGRAYRAGPFQLEVSRSGAPPAGPSSPGGAPPGAADEGEPRSAPPVWVEMTVEPEEVWLGQQVLLRVTFWQRADVSVLDARFLPPETQGFWKEDLPPERRRSGSRGGVPYEGTEVRFALFPTRAGDLEITPAQVQAQYRVPTRGRRTDPFSFFGLVAREREEMVPSGSARVRVRALPSPAPAGFTGAVGSFRIESTTDRPAGVQGEPLTWTVTIRGAGNVSAADGPGFPEIPGVRAYDAGAKSETSRDGDRVQGWKSFGRVLVPEAAGRLVLPSLDWAYFDPAEGRYVTVEVASRSLSIAPAQPSAEGEAGRIGGEIRDIRPSTRLQPLSWERPWRSPLFWTAQAVPILALAAGFVIRRRRERRERDPAGARREDAPAMLRAALARAAADRSDPWGELIRAVEQFLVDRYGSEVRGITRAALEEDLRARGVEPETARRLRALLETADRSRYLPGSGTGQADLGRAVEEARACAAGLMSRRRPAMSRLRRTGAGAAGGAALLAVLSLPALPAAALLGAASVSPASAASAAAAASSAPAASGASAAARRAFDEGVRLYRDQRYAEALQSWREVLRDGYASTELFLDLGNAAHRLGEEGWAVYYYEQARRRSPRDPDVAVNLALARREAVGEEPRVKGGSTLLSAASAALDRIPSGFGARAAAVFAWIAVAAILVSWFVARGRAAWSLRAIAGGLTVLCMLLSVAIAARESVRPEAIAVQALAARAEPGEEATVEFRLPAGSPVDLGRSSGGWQEVRLSETVRGWVPREQVAPFDPPR
ncbi:MAG: BatD family protein [Candidatus Eisenbacteria bacterium]